jgi:segregation and condensation protein A
MYNIRLPNFEGPFDLLLYFIKRDEINIYDIPIAKITEEFLSYIRLMKIFDLELAGEFLLMASNLMYIKTQLLLPRYKDESGEEIEDPRTQLVQRLLEYKQFKDASAELSQLAEEQRYVYYREVFDADENQANPSGFYKNASLFDLVKAFGKVIQRGEEEESKEHVVNLFPITVDEKKGYIMKVLSRRHRASFFDITKGENKAGVVVTVLSLLELMRNRKIVCRQSEVFEDIVIALRPDLN